MAAQDVRGFPQPCLLFPLFRASQKSSGPEHAVNLLECAKFVDAKGANNQVSAAGFSIPTRFVHMGAAGSRLKLKRGRSVWSSALEKENLKYVP